VTPLSIKQLCRPVADLPRRALPGLLLTLAACARRAIEPPAGVAPRGQVLLLRGLANVFSTGMDSLGAQLAAVGFRAEVCNHLDWQVQTQQLVAAARNGSVTRPVAVIGHSRGADDAIRLAGAAGAEGLALDLLVTFDPVRVGVVPPGPRHVMNFFLEGGFWGTRLEPAPGFDGSLENIDVAAEGLTHFDIDKSVALHARVLAALERQALHSPS